MHPQPIQPLSSAPRLDPGDEALLRATLTAHAPATVDTAHGWAAIADRLTTASTATQDHRHTGQSERNGHPAAGSGPVRRRTRLPRALTRIAAAVAVAAVLMGFGFGLSYYLTAKGNTILRQNLYTTVNQRQTDQGVTFVVDRAYADSDSTSILYYVELSPALAARGYTSATPMTFDLTDQFGDTGGAGFTICHPGSGSVLSTCEISDNAFAVPAGTTQLTVTYTIYRVMLGRGGDHPLQDTLRGAWNFQFTIPFHQQRVGPASGPYPIPTSQAGRVPGNAGGV